MRFQEKKSLKIPHLNPMHIVQQHVNKFEYLEKAIMNSTPFYNFLNSYFNAYKNLFASTTKLLKNYDQTKTINLFTAKKTFWFGFRPLNFVDRKKIFSAVLKKMWIFHAYVNQLSLDFTIL